ncbi:protoporphyrinogen oxidase [Actinocrinis puniceicyclus]|uniref:Coproporphyrinogen III oxidase n=1 Tax=Actinocrinis puniceicyclus TaxID=977794 RepID=A0A8J7WIV6_9ACTN|nr:protoporphyrinogen oxidase [Actinocrinis puniceicyclus]MBS2963088.1 protoporphyrinogen oxidase [Actinocrinis puniceicyclus]
MSSPTAFPDASASASKPAGDRLAVVGGGITGLAAAQAAARDGWRVTLLEADTRAGGKLALGAVAGVQVDLGAESLRARRPEGTGLAREVGLGEDVVHPATTAAGIYSRGELHPLPGGQIMGVPGDLRALAASGLLNAAALARVRADRLLPRTPVEGDVAVGEYVAKRLGREVVDRVVEPLLGGVYAGHADRLSLAATVPQLAALAAAGTSLANGVRDLLMTRSASDAGTATPVFAGIRGGVGRLPSAVAEDARGHGADVRIGTGVRTLIKTSGGWRLELSDGTALDVHAVLLAVPAPEAARLLSGHAETAVRQLGGIEYASMAVITLAFPAAALGPEGLPGSGFLVPPVDGRTIKAATFSTAKWPWMAHAAGNLVILRTSLGRHGEERDLDRDDEDLVKAALSDLGEVITMAAAPVDAHVQRWMSALPQYAVGHLDRVAAIRAALPAGIAVAGAAYDGVGIPACIASARNAFDTIKEGREQP